MYIRFNLTRIMYIRFLLARFTHFILQHSTKIYFISHIHKISHIFLLPLTAENKKNTAYAQISFQLIFNVKARMWKHQHKVYLGKYGKRCANF